jgi:glycosyltransferase involved in cell wall biosynthesis
VRLLFVADGHSPIAINWISHFVEAGHEVHLASTFPAGPDLPLASLTLVPLTFSGMIPLTFSGMIPLTSSGVAASQGRGASEPGRSRLSGIVRGARGLRLRVFLRHWLGPLTIPSAARRLRLLIEQLRPDLVHGLRIPLEGMLAAAAEPSVPLLLSVWGNDFTFHARSSPLLARRTRQALHRADALHVDCARDLRLAADWGYPSGRPSIVLPGNGGIRPEVFFPGRWDATEVSPGVAAVLAGIPEGAPVVVNPRGFRAYVRQDVFFRSLLRVIDECPGVQVVCPAMAGEGAAERWIHRLGLGSIVHVLPQLSPPDMAAAFRRAQVSVSPSTHDGTPNTLLEAMACGCTPVAGDLESIREWIDDGVNGLLADPRSPDHLAQKILRALGNPDLRSRAAAHNRRLISERATYTTVMAQAEAFYQQQVRG